MEKDLLKFNMKVNNINEDITELVKYEDDENVLHIQPMYLITNLTKKEYTDEELKKVKFDLGLKQDFIDTLEKTKTKRLIDKSLKTKNKKDIGTIIEEEVEVYIAWELQNGLKQVKLYKDQKQALADLNIINKKYYELIK